MERLSKEQRNAITEITIKDIIKPAVIKVRRELRQNNDVTEGDHKNYAGLCDASCVLLHEYLKKDIEKGNAKGLQMKFGSFHGEQCHTWKIPSRKWYYQHTWAYLDICGIRIYIDPTCQQFRWIWPDIPDYYISDEAPKWFYPDSKNPAWRRPFRWFNKHIKVNVKGIAGITHKEGIIEYLQYECWGRFCDWLFYGRE